MKTIIFVTAFKDIGRENWPAYRRSNKEYIANFIKLATNIKYYLVCYIDEDIHKYLMQIYKFRFPDNIIFITHNNAQQFDMYYEKYNTANKQILTSIDYQNKIPVHRKLNPEHCVPEYNTMMYMKNYFIKLTKDILPMHDFYSWLDFGICQTDDLYPVPKNIDLDKLSDKIYYSCFQMPNLDNKLSETKLLQSDTIYIAGSQYIVPNKLVDMFDKLWQDKIDYWISINNSDDDQNLILQIYYDRPDIFNLVRCQKWMDLYNHLQDE